MHNFIRRGNGKDINLGDAHPYHDEQEMEKTPLHSDHRLQSHHDCDVVWCSSTMPSYRSSLGSICGGQL